MTANMVSLINMREVTHTLFLIHSTHRTRDIHILPVVRGGGGWYIEVITVA